VALAAALVTAKEARAKELLIVKIRPFRTAFIDKCSAVV
jgi:hypothetical protein